MALLIHRPFVSVTQDAGVIVFLDVKKMNARGGEVFSRIVFVFSAPEAVWHLNWFPDSFTEPQRPQGLYGKTWRALRQETHGGGSWLQSGRTVHAIAFHSHPSGWITAGGWCNWWSPSEEADWHILVKKDPATLTESFVFWLRVWGLRNPTAVNTQVTLYIYFSWKINRLVVSVSFIFALFVHWICMDLLLAQAILEVRALRLRNQGFRHGSSDVQGSGSCCRRVWRSLRGLAGTPFRSHGTAHRNAWIHTTCQRKQCVEHCWCGSLGSNGCTDEKDWSCRTRSWTLCIRERVGCASTFGLLGPCRSFQWWRCEGVLPPPCCGDQAWTCFHVGLHRKLGLMWFRMIQISGLKTEDQLILSHVLSFECGHE